METSNKTLCWDAPDWGQFSITTNPLGLIRLELKPRENYQQHFSFMASEDNSCSLSPGDGIHLEVAQQIKEYLLGSRQEFNLPIRISPSCDQKVLVMVSSIKYGQIATYAEIADELGTPGNVRQIIAALMKNPLPLIIPCHRIVKSSDDIGSYIWGLQIKRRLLKLEVINNSN